MKNIIEALANEWSNLQEDKKNEISKAFIGNDEASNVYSLVDSHINKK